MRRRKNKRQCCRVATTYVWQRTRMCRRWWVEASGKVLRSLKDSLCDLEKVTTVVIPWQRSRCRARAVLVTVVVSKWVAHRCGSVRADPRGLARDRRDEAFQRYFAA